MKMLHYPADTVKHVSNSLFFIIVIICIIISTKDALRRPLTHA